MPVHPLLRISCFHDGTQYDISHHILTLNQLLRFMFFLLGFLVHHMAVRT